MDHEIEKETVSIAKVKKYRETSLDFILPAKNFLTFDVKYLFLSQKRKNAIIIEPSESNIKQFDLNEFKFYRKK